MSPNLEPISCYAYTGNNEDGNGMSFSSTVCLLYIMILIQA